jgi:alkylhydroperoxidase family enzyme
VRRAQTTEHSDFEMLVVQLTNYELSDLPPRTKMAMRLADELSLQQRPNVDPDFYAALREHFSDDQILDLGMCIGFVIGWQRFIEAFGILPDRWKEGDRLPWRTDDEMATDDEAGPDERDGGDDG